MKGKPETITDYSERMSREHKRYMRTMAERWLDDGARLIGKALDNMPDDGSGLRPRLKQLSNDADKLCGDIVEGKFQ